MTPFGLFPTRKLTAINAMFMAVNLAKAYMMDTMHPDAPRGIAGLLNLCFIFLLFYGYGDDVAEYIDDVLEPAEKYFGKYGDEDQLIRL